MPNLYDTREVTIQSVGRGKFEVVYDTGTRMVVVPDETVTVSKPFTIEGIGKVGELNVRMRFLAPPKKPKTKSKKRGARAR